MRAGNAAIPYVVGLVMLLAGCGVASPPAATSPASASTPASPALAPHAAVTQQAERLVYVAAAGGPNQVLVAVGSDAGGAPRVELLAATVAGTEVRDIGPRVPAGAIPDSVFFLDGNDGWFATYSGAGDGETLYRTRDGGRSWQAFPAPSHVVAASTTTDAVQFVTPDDGWLADVEPTGPTETLYHSADGGASWQQVAALNQALPRLGVVEFEPGDAVGWLGGVAYPGALEFTADHGRDWQAAALPDAQAGSVVGMPAIFGATLIEPAVDCVAGGTELRTYLSSDNGARWSLTGAADIAPGCQPISTAFPSQRIGWAAALRRGRVVVERTTNQGRRWATLPAPELVTSYPPEIVAPDARHAWLLVTGVDGTRVYVTRDAGKTWQRIDKNLAR